MYVLLYRFAPYTSFIHSCIPFSGLHFAQGGVKSRTNVQLCAWKRACLGFSAEGFDTLKELFESDGSDGVDRSCLSLNAISTQQVAMLKDAPLTQSLFLHIYARQVAL